MGVVNHSHKVGETLPPHLIRLTYIVIFMFVYMGYYMYLCIVKKGDTHMNNYKQGLSDGHIKQIIRRKMTQKSVPSKKVYNRKNYKGGE